MNALVRYAEPFSGLSNWLEDFLGTPVFESIDRELLPSSWPRVDITEEENAFVIRADVPGLDKKDVSITVENGTLRIEGEKKSERKVEKGKYYHLERSYGGFSRSFALPEAVDAEHIGAALTNGVLELTIPKTEKAKPKAIEVKVS